MKKLLSLVMVTCMLLSYSVFPAYALDESELSGINNYAKISSDWETMYVTTVDNNYDIDSYEEVTGSMDLCFDKTVDIASGFVMAFSYESNTVVVQDDHFKLISGDTITITGEGSDGIVVLDGNVNFKFNSIDVEIDNTFFELKEGASSTITFVGDSYVTANSSVGFLVPENTELTFTGSGSLYVENKDGVAIGNELGWSYKTLGTINIKNTEMIVVGGISGYKGDGEINISNSEVYVTAPDYAISGEELSIVIKNSNVTAIVNSGDGVSANGVGAAIGGINSDVEIIGSEVKASSIWGAGIGSTCNYPNGTIIIKDSTIDAHSNEGAAIGGGCNGNGGTIIIKDSNVKAKGWTYAIGSNDPEFEADKITVENSTMDLSSIYGITGSLYCGKSVLIDGVEQNETTTTTVEEPAVEEDEEEEVIPEIEWPSPAPQEEPEEETPIVEEPKEEEPEVQNTTEPKNEEPTTTPATQNGGGGNTPAVQQIEEDKMEYTINSITLRDISSFEVTELEKKQLIIEISVTNNMSQDLDTLLIATYDKNGRMTGLYYFYSEIAVGKTSKFGVGVDNTNGDIYSIKAMMLPFGAPTPIAESATYN